MEKRRRILIVDRRLQYQIIGVAFLSGLILSLFFALSLRFLSSRILGSLEAAQASEEFIKAVAREFEQTTVQYAILTFVCIGWSWIVSLYLSHRISGPVYNMEKTLDRFAAGEKSARILLRKHDNFKSLADKINNLLDKK